jgi:hypothetical protein
LRVAQHERIERGIHAANSRPKARGHAVNKGMPAQ